jgi:2-polyprenyl-3-methyl-5-hydroxy-6-metoxy-1,4-benzoquinol methylase
MGEIPPIVAQQSFWNSWNEHYGKGVLDSATKRQAEIVGGWLESLGRSDLDILEVGCGSGWFCPQLTRFGHVIGTDLSEQGLERAKQRAPEATFVQGDFMNLDFGANSFDVVVALEVLSHMPDQKAFVGKLAGHLRPGG